MGNTLSSPHRSYPIIPRPQREQDTMRKKWHLHLPADLCEGQPGTSDQRSANIAARPTKSNNKHVPNQKSQERTTDAPKDNEITMTVRPLEELEEGEIREEEEKKEKKPDIISTDSSSHQDSSTQTSPLHDADMKSPKSPIEPINELCPKFTSTGICNAICPRIHDSSKRALCAFRLCRMECPAKQSCRYSHVWSVHNAPTCRSFMETRHCWDGHRCAFAHNPYVFVSSRQCDQFSEMGYCEKGSTCLQIHQKSGVNQQQVVGTTTSTNSSHQRPKAEEEKGAESGLQQLERDIQDMKELVANNSWHVAREEQKEGRVKAMGSRTAEVAEEKEKAKAVAARGKINKEVLASKLAAERLAVKPGAQSRNIEATRKRSREAEQQQFVTKRRLSGKLGDEVVWAAPEVEEFLAPQTQGELALQEDFVPF